MPLPKRKAGESQEQFLERCIPEAYTGTDPKKSKAERSKQATAMCFSQWREGAHASMDILLYHDIGEFDATAKDVIQQLATVKPTDPVTVGIFSYGGNVFEGEAIYAALKRHKGRVVTRIDGLAASAASYIAMAGQEIVMSPNSFMMIHEASVAGFMSATRSDLIDIQGRLEILNKQMVRVYAMRTGQDEGKIREMMAAETWLTAEQCAQLGFCDRIDDDLSVPLVANTSSNLGRYHYRHVPVAVSAYQSIQARRQEAPSEPEPERPARPVDLLSDEQKVIHRRTRMKARMKIISNISPLLRPA